MIESASNPHNYSMMNNMLDDNYKEIISLKTKLKIPVAYPAHTLEIVYAEHTKEELLKKLHEAQQHIQKPKDKILSLEKENDARGKA